MRQLMLGLEILVGLDGEAHVMCDYMAIVFDLY